MCAARRARRIGVLAQAVLERPLRRGGVAGVFSQGLNVRFRNPDALVAVQTAAVPLHPYAVEVDEPPLVAEVGASVRLQEDGLAVGPVLVDLSEARVEPLVLEPLTPAEARRVQDRLPIVADARVAAEAVGAIEPFEARLAAILAVWIRRDEPTVLLDLVGLGGGSTPAGDDLLVGLLAGLVLNAMIRPHALGTLRALRSLLHGVVRQRTALPAAQSIEAVLAAQAPEPLCRLSTVLRDPTSRPAAIRRAADRVASLGATSGRFLLAGLVSGLEAGADRSMTRLDGGRASEGRRSPGCRYSGTELV